MRLSEIDQNFDCELDCDEILAWEDGSRSDEDQGGPPSSRRVKRTGTCPALYKKIFADIEPDRSTTTEGISGKIVDRDEDKKVDFAEFDESLENLDEANLKYLIRLLVGGKPSNTGQKKGKK